MKKLPVCLFLGMMRLNNFSVENASKNTQSTKMMRNKKNVPAQKKTPSVAKAKKSSVVIPKQNDLVKKYTNLPEDQQIKIAQYHDKTVNDMKTLIKNEVHAINTQAASDNTNNSVNVQDSGVTKTFSKENIPFHPHHAMQQLHQKIFEEPLKTIKS